MDFILNEWQFKIPIFWAINQPGTISLKKVKREKTSATYATPENERVRQDNIDSKNNGPIREVAKKAKNYFLLVV